MGKLIPLWIVLAGCGFHRINPAQDDVPGDDAPPGDGAKTDAAIDAPPPTIVYVQGQVATNLGMSDTAEATFTQDQVAGNFNVVVVSWASNTQDVASVLDMRGNTYTAALAKTALNGISQRIFYATNIAAGPNKVTATLNGTQPDPKIRIFEYAGIVQASPIDGTPGVAAGIGPMSASLPTTTTHANDLLFAANYTTGTTTDPGTGWTQRQLDAGDIVEDRIVDVTGTYSATAPLTAVNAWIMQLVAFKGAP